MHDAKPQDNTDAPRCGACGAVLIGRYCHECGQQRLDHRLTTKDLAADFARRVLRFDRVFIATLWRAIRAPGRLAHDYLAGRRRGILDPIVYFAGTVFIQFLLAVLSHMVAFAFGGAIIFDTLGTVGGMIVLKICVIFFAAAVWRLLTRGDDHSTAEIAVFAIYCFGTLGLLWAVLPLTELLLRLPLSSHRGMTVAVVLMISAVYLTYGIREFARTTLALAAAKSVFTLALAYGLMAAAVGIGRSIDFMAPLLGAP